MNCDLINVWPNYADFPPFRRFLLEHSDRFHNIITMFSEHNMDSYDYTKFFQRWAFSHILHCSGKVFVEGPFNPTGGRDWRDQAINMALANSKAEYVWFAEQDFLAKWPEFLAKIEEGMSQKRPIMGLFSPDPTYRLLHPACLIVQRHLIEKTSKDFSPDTPKYDHFDKFAQELKKLVTDDEWVKADISTLGLVKGKDWYHMAGLSRNYQLAIMGQPPNHNIPEFLVYNSRSRDMRVEQSRDYLDLSVKAEELLADSGKFLYF